MQCSLLLISRSFKSCYLLYFGLLLGSFFDPEDTGNIFLRNDDRLQTAIQFYVHEDRALHKHHCEDLKSYRNKVSSDLLSFGNLKPLLNI
jgi:hypothetical protein